MFKGSWPLSVSKEATGGQFCSICVFWYIAISARAIRFIVMLILSTSANTYYFALIRNFTRKKSVKRILSACPG